MARYTVTHSCGHDQKHQLFGKSKDRERKLAWLEETLCSDCWKAAQDKKHAEESAQAQAANAASGLPTLEGSPKQIAWAETIRKTWLSELAEYCQKVRADIPSYWSSSSVELRSQAAQELSDATYLVESELRKNQSARWWIDHRDSSVKQYGHDEILLRIDTACPTVAALLLAAKAEEVARG